MRLFSLMMIALGMVVFSEHSAYAQRRRVDLDDMMIKGELHSDDRLMILARQKNELKNIVKFRTSYKEEILQELPTPKPRREF